MMAASFISANEMKGTLHSFPVSCWSLTTDYFVVVCTFFLAYLKKKSCSLLEVVELAFFLGAKFLALKHILAPLVCTRESKCMALLYH